MRYEYLMRKVDDGDVTILAWEDTDETTAQAQIEIYRAAGRELQRPKRKQVEVTEIPTATIEICTEEVD